MRADRRGAAGAERSQKDTLRGGCRTGSGIVDRRQQSQDALVVLAALHSESALARRGEHRVHLQPFRHRALDPESQDAGCSKDHRVELPVLHLSDARVDVAANRTDVEIVAEAEELRCTAQAARPHDRARRKLSQAEAVARDDAVPDVLALTHGAERDARRLLRRQVLQRMDGEVDRARPQRLLELCREQALAADGGQRHAAGLRSVTARCDRLRPAGDLGPGLPEGFGDAFGLRACERRRSRAEHHCGEGRRRGLGGHGSCGAGGPNSSRIEAATSSMSSEAACWRSRTVGSCRSFLTNARERCSIRSAISGSRSPRCAQCTVDLLPSNRLRAPPKGRDERLHLELAVTAAEAFDLVLHDRLDARNLGQARPDGTVETGAKVVDVEEPDAGNNAGAALDVGRYRQIHEDERAVSPARHRLLDGLGGHDRALGGRRRHGHVRPRERLRELIEPVGIGPEQGRRLASPLVACDWPTRAG